MKTIFNKIHITTIILIILLTSIFFTGYCIADDQILINNASDGVTLYVDDDGNADYTSIHDALDDANDGDTIFVYNGKYQEPQLIIQKKINLIGENKQNTYLRFDTGKNHPGITVKPSFVTIQNFKIKNSGPGLYTTGIRIINHNVTIKNCYLLDTPVGISVWAKDAIIEKCEFNNCQDEGIVVLTSSFSEVNARINKCIFRNNCDGIELQQSCGNIIMDCEFYDQTHCGIDAIDKKNNNNLINGCIFENSQLAGIYFVDSDINLIMGNKFKNNGEKDIWLTGGCRNNVISLNVFNTGSSDNGDNIWYNPVNNKGNYWSDYKNKYPNAKDDNNDGVWDTPYSIPGGNNKDYYPLTDEDESKDENPVNKNKIKSRIITIYQIFLSFINKIKTFYFSIFPIITSAAE